MIVTLALSGAKAFITNSLQLTQRAKLWPISHMQSNAYLTWTVRLVFNLSVFFNITKDQPCL